MKTIIFILYLKLKLRLDFINFVIAGPSTRSLGGALIFNGQQAAAGVLASDATQCVTDQVSTWNNSIIAFIIDKLKFRVTKMLLI
jgi:hypothetical protein